jgi:peptide/nickel transport system substrate-binding protein
VYFNFKRLPFSDPHARQAVQLAVDVDQINKTLFNGLAETPHGYFPTSNPFSDPSIVFPSPDLTKAQALVDQYVSDHGQDLNFTFTTGSSGTTVALAQILQSQLSKLNHVKLTISSVAISRYAAQLVSANFDAIYFAYNGIDPDSEWLEQMLSKGSRDFQGYVNSQVDSLGATSLATTDTSSS